QLKKAVPVPCTKSDAYPECTVPETAVGLLNDSFKEYNVNSAGQQAALIAIMNFESSGFAYKTNLNPDNHGQGTYSQMQYPAIEGYVLSVPALKTKYDSLTKTVTDENTLKDEVLKLAIADQYVFGAAAWYLKKSGKCDESVWSALDKGDDAGFTKYIQCV
ncbi:hypothetical protein BJ085DRAFT_11434, partial [Dimargaris cristalligena]